MPPFTCEDVVDLLSPVVSFAFAFSVCSMAALSLAVLFGLLAAGACSPLMLALRFCRLPGGLATALDSVVAAAGVAETADAEAWFVLLISSNNCSAWPEDTTRLLLQMKLTNFFFLRGMLSNA